MFCKRIFIQLTILLLLFPRRLLKFILYPSFLSFSIFYALFAAIYLAFIIGIIEYFTACRYDTLIGFTNCVDSMKTFQIYLISIEIYILFFHFI